MIDLTQPRWANEPDPAIIEQLDRMLAHEQTNRNLIKGLSQRLDRLERGTAAPPPRTPERPEDV